MFLLTAMLLLLIGIFWYYQAIVRLRAYLNEVQPEREAADKFFALQELSLVSNPISMYCFIFHGSVGAVDDSEALGKARRNFISSFITCVVGAAMAFIHVLLH